MYTRISQVLLSDFMTTWDCSVIVVCASESSGSCNEGPEKKKKLVFHSSTNQTSLTKHLLSKYIYLNSVKYRRNSSCWQKNGLLRLSKQTSTGSLQSAQWSFYIWSSTKCGIQQRSLNKRGSGPRRGFVKHFKLFHWSISREADDQTTVPITEFVQR